ncbi:hypothetical protein Drose_22795 [Dactylosporangium roseum]|uniref:Uncharacterized protein n=1 Tax=Dactylosporangium roseum TaxID=47989 RepID=A0ABY5Z0R2_9ACTN|nr:hypothetical protein [Dactylosporangium roseum]UWZ34079.1 hypothetical protein Drose_22795 [Dactylosporangium roseum]
MTRTRWWAAVAAAVAMIGLGTVALAGRLGHGPAYGLLCPEQVTSYAVAPTPGVPLARGTLTVRLGDRFAVGGHEGPLPAGDPLLTGEVAVVRAVGETVFATGERCGRAVSGYRYSLFEAVRPGEVTVGDVLIRVT